MRRYWLILAAALSLCAVCYLFGLRRGVKASRIDVIEKTDTLIVIDTITLIKPVFKTERVVDSILVYYPVPVYAMDTVYISLPRTERVYEDSSYRAVVSGYQPSLDSISVFSRQTHVHTVTVEKVKVRPRVSLGVQVGYGVRVSGTPELSPYVGIGFSVNLANFAWHD